MSKPSDFNDECLKALGRVCLNFQALEMDIAFLCWIMISPDTTLGQMVTAQVSFKDLRALSSSLLRYRVNDNYSQFRDRLARLLKEACKIGEERNSLIHSAWFVDNTGTASRVKWRNSQKQGFQMQHESMDAKRLNEFAKRILQASEDFAKLFNDLHKEKLISSKPGIST